MTDHDKFLSLTTQITAILNERINLSAQIKRETDTNRIRLFGEWKRVDIPRKLCKARIHRLRLELNEVLKEIESKCETISISKGGEEWYND